MWPFTNNKQEIEKLKKEINTYKHSIHLLQQNQFDMLNENLDIIDCNGISYFVGYCIINKPNVPGFNIWPPFIFIPYEKDIKDTTYIKHEWKYRSIHSNVWESLVKAPKAVFDYVEDVKSYVDFDEEV